jgi:hypothetical protein
VFQVNSSLFRIDIGKSVESDHQLLSGNVGVLLGYLGIEFACHDHLVIREVLLHAIHIDSFSGDLSVNLQFGLFQHFLALGIIDENQNWGMSFLTGDVAWKVSTYCAGTSAHV